VQCVRTPIKICRFPRVVKAGFSSAMRGRDSGHNVQGSKRPNTFRPRRASTQILTVFPLSDVVVIIIICVRRRLHCPLLANEYFPQNIPLRLTLGFGSMTREDQPDRTAAAVVEMMRYYLL